MRKKEDETGALRNKCKTIEKKMKEEMDEVKKQKDEAVKKVEAIYGRSKKAVTSRQTSGTLKSKSAIDKLASNKENIENNNDASSISKLQEAEEDEEKNKLRRQLSLMRCQIKKLEIEIKDLKS